MPIDTSIAMGYRPPQIEMPDVQNAREAQLRAAEQQNVLGAIQLGEAARSNQIRNNLREVLGQIDPNMPEDKVNALIDRELVKTGDLSQIRAHRKNVAEIQAERLKGLKEQALTNKADVETKIEKTKLFTTRLPIIAQNPSDQAIQEWATTLVQNDIMSMVQATAGMNEMLKLPLDQRRQKLMESALSAEKALEQHYMQEDLGGTKRIVAVPKLGEGKLRVVSEQQVTLDPYEKGKLDTERYKASRGGGGGSETGPGTKLEKGERWNAAEQRIETVPGSKLHVAQSDKHNKDREALKGVETKTQSAITKIDELLSPKYIDGFRANFSGDLPFSGYVTQYVAPDARRRIDSLKSDMKAAGLELIRTGGSIGAMTQQEWPIVEQMIAALTPDMTADEAELQVKKIREYMEKIKNNAKDAYQTEWGDTQYFKPTEKSSAGGLSPADKQALDWANSNPKDPRAAQIKQRLGVNK
jgi:hypothetical protein